MYYYTLYYVLVFSGLATLTAGDQGADVLILAGAYMCVYIYIYTYIHI